MDEASSMYPDSNNKNNILNRINGTKEIIVEILEREATSKRLYKYVAAFDYFDKSFIVL